MLLMQLTRICGVMKADVALYPLVVGLLGAQAIPAPPAGLADLVEQSRAAVVIHPVRRYFVPTCIECDCAIISNRRIRGQNIVLLCGIVQYLLFRTNGVNKLLPSICVEPTILIRRVAPSCKAAPCSTIHVMPRYSLI